MNKGDQGTTGNGDNQHNRETMPEARANAVPKLSSEMQTAPDRLAAIPDERKAEIEAESKRKITFMEREYWKLRNEEQDYMRCPFCKRGDDMRLNFVGQPMCCPLFAKAFGAILERQAQVDMAAQMVRNCHSVGLVN
jgi:hypothetical protein